MLLAAAVVAMFLWLLAAFAGVAVAGRLIVSARRYWPATRSAASTAATTRCDKTTWTLEALGRVGCDRKAQVNDHRRDCFQAGLVNLLGLLSRVRNEDLCGGVHAIFPVRFQGVGI